MIFNSITFFTWPYKRESKLLVISFASMLTHYIQASLNKLVSYFKTDKHFWSRTFQWDKPVV